MIYYKNLLNYISIYDAFLIKVTRKIAKRKGHLLMTMDQPWQVIHYIKVWYFLLNYLLIHLLREN